jgi:hypothetical protein
MHRAEAMRGGPCFVGRTPTGVGTRRGVEGRSRVPGSGNPIPNVRIWCDACGNQAVFFARDSWVSGAFLKSGTRTACRVADVERETGLDGWRVREHA